MLNDALFYESYEIIGGEKIMSAAAANPYHSSIIVRLIAKIGVYVLENKIGYAFPDNVDVHFADGSVFKPDFVFISKENAEIIKWKGAIYGVPDMVVEVLSKSTMNRDVTIKKDAYESNGVKEYWIIDPWKESISVYLLRGGKFELDDEYIYYDEDEIKILSDEEKASVKHEVKVKSVDGLTINLKDIFDWINF